MRKRYLPLAAALLLSLSGCGSSTAPAQETATASTTAAETTAAETTTVAAVTETTTEAAQEETISEGFVRVSEGEEYVTLFAEPDTGSTKLARLYRNEPVAIYALEGSWYRVDFDGLTGYLDGDAVAFTKQTEPVTTTTAQTEPPTDPPTDPPTEPEPEPEPRYTVTFDVYDIASANNVYSGAHEILVVDEIYSDNGTPSVDGTEIYGELAATKIIVTDCTAGSVNISGTFAVVQVDGTVSGYYPFTYSGYAG